MKGIPDMIKVMNIITDTNIGGAGRLIIQCLKCFDRTKFDIVLVVPSQSALIPLIKNEGYRVIETEKGHDKSWEKGALHTRRKARYCSHSLILCGKACRVSLRSKGTYIHQALHI